VVRNLRDTFVAEFSFIVGLLVVLAVGIPLRAQTDIRYGVVESKDVMVAMRDGVKLAADIYRPMTRKTLHRLRTPSSPTDTS
jgi:hypothetical protein